MSSPRLVGVGVGPGDPELITLKALNILREAQVILVPATESTTGQLGRAEAIVLANLPTAKDKIISIPFSMADRSGVTKKRSEAWQTSANVAIQAFTDGAKTVCFATIGDPSLFSTFSYLAAKVKEHTPEINVELIPGITAMQALASAASIPLAEGTESLTLLPATAGLDRITELSDMVDTLVIYKAGRKLPEIVAKLKEHGRSAILGTNIGLENEHIIPITQLDSNHRPNYFSTVLSTKSRDVPGGRL